MGTIKETINKTGRNLPGAIVGGVAGYFVAKKAIKTEKKWVYAVSIIVGAVVGATLQAKFMPSLSKGMPTAAIVTAPVTTPTK